MNNKRRGKISQASIFLDRAYDIISDVHSQEGDSMDNVPENLRDSEAFIKMEDAEENLSSALDALDEVRDRLNSAIE